MSPSEAARPPGRPRDSTRERALLDAALAVLATVGWDALTLEGVARRAGASKATIYRRWPDREALVIDALRRRVPEPLPVPDDTGSVRDDLLEQCRLLAATVGGMDGRLLLALSEAALRQPALGEDMLSAVGPRGSRLPRELLDRAVRRGELSPDIDGNLFEELTTPLMLSRITAGQPLDERYLAHLVDDVLLPVLRASADPTTVRQESSP